MDMAVDKFIVFPTIFKPHAANSVNRSENKFKPHTENFLKGVCETRALHMAMVGSFQ